MVSRQPRPPPLLGTYPCTEPNYYRVVSDSSQSDYAGSAFYNANSEEANSDEIATQRVTLQVADGTSMNAYTARPAEEGKFPGMLVFQEAFGVNAHIRDITERIAREGYVAIAPELFHRTGPGFEGSYTDFPPSCPTCRR